MEKLEVINFVFLDDLLIRCGSLVSYKHFPVCQVGDEQTDGTSWDALFRQSCCKCILIYPVEGFAEDKGTY